MRDQSSVDSTQLWWRRHNHIEIPNQPRPMTAQARARMARSPTAKVRQNPKARIARRSMARHTQGELSVREPSGRRKIRSDMLEPDEVDLGTDGLPLVGD